MSEQRVVTVNDDHVYGTVERVLRESPDARFTRRKFRATEAGAVQGGGSRRRVDRPDHGHPQTIRLALKTLKDAPQFEADSVGRGATWTKRT